MQGLTYELRGEVAVIGLDRPEKRNAINDALIAAIEAAVRRAGDEARAMVLYGHGPSYCAGLDLVEHRARSPEEVFHHSRSWHRAFRAIRHGRIPAIAALHGATVGGGLELAAACQLRVADETAFFALPEGSRGIYVGGGASVHVARLIGASRMADMMLTGRSLDAAAAERHGIANYLVQAGGALTKALELARKMVTMAPLTVLGVLQALPRIQDMSEDDGLFVESMMAALAQSRPEAAQRLDEFAQKRGAKVVKPEIVRMTAGTGHASAIDQMLRQEFGEIAELVRQHARERPQATALIQGDSRWSYGELDRAMDQAALALQRDGVMSGEAIAIVSGTSIDYVAIFLGALRAGVAVAPLSPSSSPESLAAMIADCGAKLVFLDVANAQALAGSLPADGPPRILIGEQDHDLRTSCDFAAWLAPAGEAPRPATIAPDAPFNIIYSSGTTGTPKGIVQPHRMRWAQVQRASTFLYGRDAVTLISTPLYSNTTLVAVFPTLAHGGALLLMAKFGARQFLELAERHRATHAMLVPVQYRRIMALPDFAGFDLSSFKMKSCTSAPFDAALKADVLRRWPGGLAEVWGMTEGGGSTLLFAHERQDKLHTIGRPSPGNDIRFIDEAGREVAPGEMGEIVGHSQAMMNGYHNQPAKTAEAEWHDATGKRFIRTGDIGRLDEDGFVVLMDRKKDMIISGGFNIYPGDLEAALRQHEAVAEAAVIGITSPEWGETPFAYVSLKPGRTASAQEIREFANARLGKMQRVSGVEIVDELPRSAIGKVLKRELRNRDSK